MNILYIVLLCFKRKIKTNFFSIFVIISFKKFQLLVAHRSNPHLKFDLNKTND